jgi:uncharacterized protein (TIGR03032 family)
MRRSPAPRFAALWAAHDAAFRLPHEVLALPGDSDVDPRLLRHEVRGAWWETLEATGRALLVTREYEHLVLVLAVRGGRPLVSYQALPHPSGLAVDHRRRRLYVASTRNPNQVLEFAVGEANGGTFLPRRSWHLPGALYLHELAFVGARLHGNAVGLNAIVELREAGGFRPVWWPRAIDGERGPLFARNYLQLNSIASGPTLAASFFSASAARPSARRPGHRNFPVDGRGVVFSGRTREVVAGGLTRPHSARLHRGRLWVDNSGYGELVRLENGRFECVARLPGWTRGLCFQRGIAFVGTSRVLPRFRHYAPGLDHQRSRTGVHAVDLRSGRVLGSLWWPSGNQVFAVELAPRDVWGFPARRPGADGERVRSLFYRGLAE